jgi:hypothetical protein
MNINTRKLKQVIHSHLPYAFLFWLFGKFGEAYRLAPGAAAVFGYVTYKKRHQKKWRKEATFANGERRVYNAADLGG